MKARKMAQWVRVLSLYAWRPECESKVMYIKHDYACPHTLELVQRDIRFLNVSWQAKLANIKDCLKAVRSRAREEDMWTLVTAPSCACMPHKQKDF